MRKYLYSFYFHCNVQGAIDTFQIEVGYSYIYNKNTIKKYAQKYLKKIFKKDEDKFVFMCDVNISELGSAYYTHIDGFMFNGEFK